MGCQIIKPCTILKLSWLFNLQRSGKSQGRFTWARATQDRHLSCMPSGRSSSGKTHCFCKRDPSTSPMNGKPALYWIFSSLSAKVVAERPGRWATSSAPPAPAPSCWPCFSSHRMDSLQVRQRMERNQLQALGFSADRKSRSFSWEVKADFLFITCRRFRNRTNRHSSTHSGDAGINKDLCRRKIYEWTDATFVELPSHLLTQINTCNQVHCAVQ